MGSHLTPEELHHLEACLSKAECREAVVENIKLRMKALEAKLELSQTQLQLIQLQIERQKASLQSELDNALESLSQAKASYETVRDRVGESYGLDMKDVAYDPETGELQPTPESDSQEEQEAQE